MGLFDNLFAPDMDLGVTQKETADQSMIIEDDKLSSADTDTEVQQAPAVATTPTVDTNQFVPADHEAKLNSDLFATLPTESIPSNTVTEANSITPPVIPEQLAVAPIVTPDTFVPNTNPDWVKSAVEAVNHDTSATSPFAKPTIVTDPPAVMESEKKPDSVAETIQALQEKVSVQAEQIGTHDEQIKAALKLAQDAKNQIAVLVDGWTKTAADIKHSQEEGPSPIDVKFTRELYLPTEDKKMTPAEKLPITYTKDIPLPEVVVPVTNIDTHFAKQGLPQFTPQDQAAA